jgi:hypothetical protein
MTHIIKGRIEKLVSEGMNFQDANDQAKSEFLAFLGVTDTFDTDFENLDISVDEEYNAALLAFSIILQRYSPFLNEPTLTAELTQLLSNLSSDFAVDGLISDQAMINSLLNNIAHLNLTDIRKNVENRYSKLGQVVTIPEFEDYISKFQATHSENLYVDFVYPDMASPDPLTAPDGKIQNILSLSDTLFVAAASQDPYSVAAISPLNKSLKIRFMGSNYMLGAPNSGWEVISDHPNGFTLISQRQNELMSMLIYLVESGSATIEYYENSLDELTFTKKIHWE